MLASFKEYRYNEHGRQIFKKKTYLDGSNDFGMMIGFALECERNDLFSGTQNDVEKLFTINKQKVQTSVRITMCR